MTQNLNLACSISATSRAPRGTEQHGVEYYFLSPEEFKQRIANNEFLEYELGGKLKVARVLGKTKSMQKFYEYCVSRNATFYPELSITTNKGYDYLFGSTKYTARGVGNEEAIHYVYDLATGRPDKKLKKTYALSPLYYKSVTEDLLEQFNKLNVWNKKENGGLDYLKKSWLLDIKNVAMKKY